MASLSTGCFDVETAIADFLADAARTSLELPKMTTGQRKQAKKAVDLLSELTCVSYGLGQDRRLHVFKNAKDSDPQGAPEDKPNAARNQLSERDSRSVSVKNTFIDDWIVAKTGDEAGAEPIVTRSMPPRLQVCASISESNNREAEHDLCPIKECACEDASPYLSTAASSSGSSPRSPRSSDKEQQAVSFGMPLSADIEVRNTFIHFEDMPADRRVVRSMPHDMFRKCLLSEVSALQATSNCPQVGQVPDASSRAVPLNPQNAPTLAAGRLMMPGTQVVIDGLIKAPAFNGLSGIVQSLDEESGRYNILLSSAAGAHKTAKVKGENLLVVMPPPVPCFAPAMSLEQCESPLWAERSTSGAHPLLLAAMV